MPEGYVKIAYPLEVVGAEGSDKTLENLKASGFDVLTMGNPEAKKNVMILEDGTLLQIYVNETVSMGNYEINFQVIDKSGNKIGDEESSFVFSGTSEGYMNSVISIKDKTITISSKEYKGKKTVNEEQTIFKINADGLAKS